MVSVRSRKKIWLYALFVFAVLPVVAWLLAYASILFSTDILAHPLAGAPLFPVLCSSRGCVTTATWVTNHTIQTAFARATETAAPTSLDSLTTVARHYLVAHASLEI